MYCKKIRLKSETLVCKFISDCAEFPDFAIVHTETRVLLVRWTDIEQVELDPELYE